MYNLYSVQKRILTDEFQFVIVMIDDFFLSLPFVYHFVIELGDSITFFDREMSMRIFEIRNCANNLIINKVIKIGRVFYAQRLKLYNFVISWLLFD